jgi:Asp-tRNA(Asn)/Glu-tRNA(Gln) amidotransferase A subunit family amidase
VHLDEYAGYDAVGLRALIATGEVGAAEVEEAARRALDAANEMVNALALPLFVPALDHAQDGPFAGVPFLIKDSGPMAEGVPFFCGSRAVPGVLARHDHELMARFRATGPDVDWDSAVEAQKGELVGIAAPFLLAPRRPDPARMEAVSRRVLAYAAELTALDLVATFAAQDRVSRAVAVFFGGYDLLVTPTLGRLPAPHGTLRQDDPEHTVDSWLRSMLEYGPFTSIFNVSGQPAVSLPLAWSAGGLPIGIQLVAGYGREDLLFRVAAQLEEALPWRDRRPVNGVAGTSRRAS